MADSEVKVSSNSASEAVTPQSLVTDDHVRAVLAADKGAEARLAAWKIVDFTKRGDNYLCIVTSVEVTYELGGQSSEASYVVKLNPCFSSPLADALNDKAFVKEGNFYLNLLPELNCMLKEIGQREINFPKCFKVCLDKGKECIFLEDLRSRGYKMTDRKKGLDEAHTTLVLRELARLHAASFLLQKKYPGEDFNEKYPYLQKDMYHIMETCEDSVKLLEDSLKFAQAILKKVGGYERAVAWIDTLLPRLMDIIYEQLRFGEPKVVCHGDCWSNNLLFRYDEAGNPGSVMLLDLQLVRFSAPSTELNYFIYSSMTGEVRKPNLEVFLNRYHNTLTGIMKIAGHEEPLTREELQKDFKKKNLFGIILGLLFVPVVVIGDEGDVDSSDATADYFEGKMLKMRDKAMKAQDANPLLEQRFLTLFDEMMESGLIP